jgi:hypothetical protein
MHRFGGNLPKLFGPGRALLENGHQLRGAPQQLVPEIHGVNATPDGPRRATPLRAGRV